jgi:ribose transport system substrate-binding protein
MYSLSSIGAQRQRRRMRQTIGMVALALSAVVALAGCTTDKPNTVGTATTGGSNTCSTKGAVSSDTAIAAAQDIVGKAAGLTTKWDGPTTGPKATKGKSIVYIAANSNNTGDIGVYDGLKEAASVLGWTVKLIDGQNSSTNLNALSQAIALHPDAIALSSFDAKSAESEIARAKAAGIPVIGNHTGESSGYQASYPALFTNITSDPALISKVAAACAIVASKGKAGVTVVGCGTEIQLCLTKEDAMKEEIKSCSGCSVLATDEYPFEDIQQQEAGVATADYQRFGNKLGYMLSINDLYWDAAIPALQAAGVGPEGPPVMIAAGDGSPAAYDRIRKGQYQIATVAEPLNEHGWQVADEIVRAIAGEKPSNFETYPHLVTKENVDLEGGKKGAFDPSNGYRDAYKKAWGL